MIGAKSRCHRHEVLQGVKIDGDSAGENQGSHKHSTSLDRAALDYNEGTVQYEHESMKTRTRPVRVRQTDATIGSPGALLPRTVLYCALLCPYCMPYCVPYCVP